MCRFSEIQVNTTTAWGGTDSRRQWMLAQELPASVTIIDDVYEERRIGEEVRHQFRCVPPFAGPSSRRMDSTHCAAPSFNSGCFSRSQPGGFSSRNCSS